MRKRPACLLGARIVVSRRSSSDWTSGLASRETGWVARGPSLAAPGVAPDTTGCSGRKRKPGKLGSQWKSTGSGPAMQIHHGLKKQLELSGACVVHTAPSASVGAPSDSRMAATISVISLLPMACTG